MPYPIHEKSSVDEIRSRFDRDVERFSQLETGQTATMDAVLAMQLITQAAIASTKPILRVLDLGCGAGNNTLKLFQELGSNFDVDLVDLSQPMLERAVARLEVSGVQKIRSWQGDFRELALPYEAFDIILAAAVLHHLRDDTDWDMAFRKMYGLLRKGGSLWITDLVAHETSGVHQLMWQRYGDYLLQLGGDAYRTKVFDYIDREDSPRPVTYQLDLLRRIGFSHVELLHKNTCFAAFGAIK